MRESQWPLAPTDEDRLLLLPPVLKQALSMLEHEFAQQQQQHGALFPPAHGLSPRARSLRVALTRSQVTVPRFGRAVARLGDLVADAERRWCWWW